MLIRGEPEHVVEINGTPQSLPAVAVKRAIFTGLGGSDWMAGCETTC